MDARLDDGVFAGRYIWTDEHSFRQLNRYAGGHQFISFPLAEDGIHLGEVRARIATQHLAWVRRDLRKDRFAFGRQNRDRIGQVNFAMLISRLHLREGRPELAHGKTIDAGIDFVQLALLRRQLRILHNRSDAVFRFAEDAAIAGRVGDNRRKNRGRGISVAMSCDKRLKSFGADERRITGENGNNFRAADCSPGDEHRVTSAVLRLL